MGDIFGLMAYFSNVSLIIRGRIHLELMATIGDVSAFRGGINQEGLTIKEVSRSNVSLPLTQTTNMHRTLMLIQYYTL